MRQILVLCISSIVLAQCSPAVFEERRPATSLPAPTPGVYVNKICAFRLPVDYINSLGTSLDKRLIFQIGFNTTNTACPFSLNAYLATSQQDYARNETPRLLETDPNINYSIGIPGGTEVKLGHNWILLRSLKRMVRSQPTGSYLLFMPQFDKDANLFFNIDLYNSSGEKSDRTLKTLVDRQTNPSPPAPPESEDF